MSTALTDFLKYVRPEVPGCPEPLLVDAVLRACIDFCTGSEILTEIVELDTVAAQAVYVVAPSVVSPAAAATYPAKLRNVLKDGLALEKTNAAHYALLYERTDSGSPTTFFAPTRTQIALAPIPDAVETLELDLILRPDRDATEVADVLYDEWADTIAAGAKAILLLMLGRPWANPELGVYHQNLFDSGLSTAAVQQAQGNVDSSMHIEPPPI